MGNQTRFQDKTRCPAVGTGVSVSTKPSGGGSSGGGGGGGSSSNIIIPPTADIPKLKYNEDEGKYILAWSNAFGASSYNIKISLAGESDFVINNYNGTSIDLYTYFTSIAENRTNAAESFFIVISSLILYIVLLQPGITFCK